MPENNSQLGVMLTSGLAAGILAGAALMGLYYALADYRRGRQAELAALKRRTDLAAYSCEELAAELGRRKLSTY